jgi:hypothetical protein
MTLILAMLMHAILAEIAPTVLKILEITILVHLTILGISYKSLFFWLHIKKLDMHSLY